MDGDSKFRLATSASIGLVLAGAVAVGLYLDRSCHDEPIFTAFSQDKKMAATVIVRDCGATTGEVTNVVIHKASEDYSHGESVVSIDYRQQVELGWSQTNALEVLCRCKPDQFKNKRYEVQGVQTSFRSADIK